MNEIKKDKIGKIIFGLTSIISIVVWFILLLVVVLSGYEGPKDMPIAICIMFLVFFNIWIYSTFISTFLQKKTR